MNQTEKLRIEEKIIYQLEQRDFQAKEIQVNPEQLYTLSKRDRISANDRKFYDIQVNINGNIDEPKIIHSEQN